MYVGENLKAHPSSLSSLLELGGRGGGVSSSRITDSRKPVLSSLSLSEALNYLRFFASRHMPNEVHVHALRVQESNVQRTPQKKVFWVNTNSIYIAGKKSIARARHAVVVRAFFRARLVKASFHSAQPCGTQPTKQSNQARERGDVATIPASRYLDLKSRRKILCSFSTNFCKPSSDSLKFTYPFNLLFIHK